MIDEARLDWLCRELALILGTGFTGDIILHCQFGIVKTYNVSDRRKVEEQRTPGEERRRREGSG